MTYSRQTNERRSLYCLGATSEYKVDLAGMEQHKQMKLYCW